MRRIHLVIVATLVAVFAYGLALPASAATTASSEHMTVSPGFVSDGGDGPGGCSGYVNNLFTCHVTIRNTGTVSIAWRYWGLDGDNQQSLPATITPDHGSLAPGSSVRVTISTGDCGFSLADLADFLGWSGSSQAGSPPLGGAVLFSCG